MVDLKQPDPDKRPKLVGHFTADQGVSTDKDGNVAAWENQAAPKGMMTPEEMMNAEQVLSRAARRKCPECDGNIGRSAGPGLFVDCQHCDGTGLWLPELSEECPCRCHRQGRASLALSCCTHLDTDLDKLIVGSRLDCFDDRDRLDAAAERLGSSGFTGDKLPDGIYEFAFDVPIDDWLYATGKGTSWLEAQQAVLAEVIKAVWPEVANV